MPPKSTKSTSSSSSSPSKSTKSTSSSSSSSSSKAKPAPLRAFGKAKPAASKPTTKSSKPTKTADAKTAAKPAKADESTKKDATVEINQEMKELKIEEREITVKQITSVLFEDDISKETKKWPLVIDAPSSPCSTFLRYRDVNYINAINPDDFKEEKMRLSLLGSIRFGKTFVIDMMDKDIWNLVVEKLDKILPGLANSLLDKSLVPENKFIPLIKESDGSEYTEERMVHDIMIRNMVDNFRFVLITRHTDVNKELKQKMTVIKIMA